MPSKASTKATPTDGYSVIRTAFLLEAIANLTALPLITHTEQTLSFLLDNQKDVNSAFVFFVRLFSVCVIGPLSTALFIGSTNTRSGIGSRKATYSMIAVSEILAILVLAAEVAQEGGRAPAISAQTAGASAAFFGSMLLWRIYVLFVKPDMLLK
ncbi:unnamed protein product [Periconia digitata]|uniref:Uncharacterized protein n=1 Tax=Periconia digitata TaxID=1303443 RepID=A0A9W4UBL4_9PLEO|nr:unnamed protein product [Periconia digitata]